MPSIYMVRQGEAAAGFDGQINPGLSKRGMEQENAAAKELDAMGPMQIVTSSLARARETVNLWPYVGTARPASSNGWPKCLPLSTTFDIVLSGCRE